MQLKDQSLLECRAFVGGAWMTRDATIAVRDPAHGTLLAQVTDRTRADAAQAIDLAAGALPGWTVRRRMIWNSLADFGADGLDSSGSGYAA